MGEERNRWRETDVLVHISVQCYSAVGQIDNEKDGKRNKLRINVHGTEKERRLDN